MEVNKPRMTSVRHYLMIIMLQMTICQLLQQLHACNWLNETLTPTVEM